MTRKQLEDFLAVITEIKNRNCAIPEQALQMLKEAGVYTDSGEVADVYRCSSFVP
ncbi:MAG TPA: hypothetical protein VKY85_14785 [Candidatus Angelobacter sp.]|jgi:hypothetical protein|nr:hypothetical protein [Candidatus Angelobacter sp.]